MAGIETYLTLTEMEHELARDKRQAEEEAARAEQAKEEGDDARPERKSRRRASMAGPQGQQPQRQISLLTPAYEFTTKRVKRVGASQVQLAAPGVLAAKSNKSKVTAWLNVSSNNSGDKPQPEGPKRYTRHQPLRLTKGSWQTRMMSRLALINHSLPIFSPFSTGRKSWEMFIMALVLYNAVSVPLDLSFGMPTEPEVDFACWFCFVQGNIVTYVEYSIDLLFAIDIVASFRTAFVDAQGHLVRDTDAIAYKYLRTWFAIDLFATIPYDLILTAILKGSMNSTQVLVLKLLRTPRLLRLGRLFRIIDRFKSANLIRIVVIVCAMVLISHWLACIWYMLYKFTTFADYLEWGMFVDGAISPDQTLGAYLSAYYQSFLMMVGNNQPSHNNLERIFMILVLIMGACFYSAMVGQMAVLVANMNTVSLRHRTKQDTTLDVLRYMGLPDKQMARVQAYFTYITESSHPAAEGLSFLTDLPKALFDELTAFLYRKQLTKIPLFSDLEPSFLSALAGRMRIVTFTPQETIFRAGDLGLEMYIIRKGFVAVIGKERQMMGLLTPGEHFGEIAMLTQAKRTARCVALSNCDLCVLTTYDLKMVMKDFPASSQALQDKAGERLLQLQVAGRAGYVEGEEEDEEDEDEDEDDDYEEDDEGAEEEGQEGLARHASRDHSPPQVMSGRVVRRSIDLSGRSSRLPPTSDGVAQDDATSKGTVTSRPSSRAIGEAFEEINGETPSEPQAQIQIARHGGHDSYGGSSSVSSKPVVSSHDSGWGLLYLQPKGLQGTAIAEGLEDAPDSPALNGSSHPGRHSSHGRRGSVGPTNGADDASSRPGRHSAHGGRSSVGPTNGADDASSRPGRHSSHGRRGSVGPTNVPEEMSPTLGTTTWLRNTKSSKGLLSSGIHLPDERSSNNSLESPFHELHNQPSTNKRSARSSVQGQARSRLGSVDGVAPQSSPQSPSHKGLRSHRTTNASRRHSNLSVASGLDIPSLASGPLNPQQHVEATLSKMLAHSQGQVEELQQELLVTRQEWELDKNMRAQLYNQVGTLVHLLERLSDRIDYTEELTLDMDSRISTLERGQHSTVLGAHLNNDAPDPRMTRNPTMAATGRAPSMARSPSVAAMARAPSMARSGSMAAKTHKAVNRKSSFINTKASEPAV